MNTWKPSEGLRRAEHLVAEIHCAIIAADGVLTSLGRHRTVELIAKALDQALRDGSEMDAINSLSVVTGSAGGGGHGAWTERVPDDRFESVDLTEAAIAIATAKPKKRGRPKGSKAKRKSAKDAKTVEVAT